MAFLEEGPDKGRAWLIAFAACIINMILSGISRMIGILYVAVLHEYDVTRQEATMPFSVRNSIRMLAGPVVGLVGQRFGIRAVTFYGGIVAALGAGLCSLAPSVMWLTICWGGIHGFGFAFANTLFQVVVNQYFEKHRATASGFALSGACLGSLGFPFMFEAILDAYGLRGAFLILGGIVMNVLPPALLLCSPPWLKNNSKKKPNRSRATSVIKDTKKDEKVETQDEITATEAESEVNECRYFRSCSFSNCPVDGIELRRVKRIISYEARNNESNCKAKDQTSPGVYVIYGSKSLPTDTTFNCGENELEPPAMKKVVEGVTNGSHSNDFNSKSTMDPKLPKKKSMWSNILGIAKLYKNPVYMLISICMATYIIIFIPILTVIVDYSKDKGIKESDGKYLINAMALGDLIGRMGFGWVTDRGYMTVSNFMVTALILQGAVVAMFPLAQSLYPFMVLIALYGMMAGSMLILFPILVLKYVAGDQQSVAMGCVGFFSGLVSFVIPSIIGHFRDNVGSYDGMFYAIGGVSVLSGALWLLEPATARMQMKKQEKASQKR